MVASHLLSFAASCPTVNLVCTDLVSFASSRWAYRFSIVSHSCTNLDAVFCPTPATPEMLSELSPMSAFRSISDSGANPYSSRKRSGVNGIVSLLVVRRTVTRSLTSCKLSRSPVRITQSASCALQAAASVPRMSSAS